MNQSVLLLNVSEQTNSWNKQSLDFSKQENAASKTDKDSEASKSASISPKSAPKE